MEEPQKTLFGDDIAENQKVAQTSSEKMFISGDLSSYSLPEQFLKEKKPLSDFLKGFLFCCFCCFLFFIMVVITGSVENDDETMQEVFFVSDGEQKNISYVLNPLWDIEEPCDTYIASSNYEYNFNRQCWKLEKEGLDVKEHGGPSYCSIIKVSGLFDHSMSCFIVSNTIKVCLRLAASVPNRFYGFQCWDLLPSLT